ncbi:hypothetical protein [Lyngbya sp. PCC 8106]|uniref:hypothetical protein n=1 Tax=Lyngbya sp. (strain PCC 8106) TaxID=313612 RepID=UPI0000EAC155|nr:hypothetical protein [Lyngbya sp. PCC 8106]EAW35575.1 hypothetical protein L8106_13230 [Lyngbya sp. PCC 8106]
MKTTKINIPKYKRLTLTILVSSTTMLTILLPGLAQIKPEYFAENTQLAQAPDPCPDPPRIPPAKETERVTVSRLGISFNKPVNYRLEENPRDNNLILLYNPADDHVMDCYQRNRIRGGGHRTLPIAIRIETSPSNTSLLPEIGRTIIRLENIRPTTIANQKGMVYVVKSIMGRSDNLDTSLEASFLTPNQQNKITVSFFTYGEQISQVDQQAFNVVVSSLSLI